MTTIQFIILIGGKAAGWDIGLSVALMLPGTTSPDAPDLRSAIRVGLALFLVTEPSWPSI